jgi:hypothetical protein
VIVIGYRLEVQDVGHVSEIICPWLDLCTTFNNSRSLDFFKVAGLLAGIGCLA